MNTIDLKKVIADNNLNKKEVAKHLFPGNSYPVLALNRVIKGDAKLDSDQISKLSLFANCTIEDLYGIKFRPQTKDRKMFFESEDYKAELNIDTWTTKVFHKDSLFHESVIHKSSIALSDYLEQLTSIIKNHKNEN